MAERPAIPAAMRRDVLIESGYRCAIPHCRETQIDVHHIVDYAVVQEHTFDNLIALCPNDHRRVTNHEIPRKAIQQIKANLSVLNHRYSDLERRFLERAAIEKRKAGEGFLLSGGLDLLMSGLLEDGLVTKMALPIGNPFMPLSLPPGAPPPPPGSLDAFAPWVAYNLTDKGEEFVQHWLTAEPLD